MSYIFLECSSRLTEAGVENTLACFKALREEDPGFPKLVLLDSGLRVVAATSDFDLCRVQIDPEEEAIVDRVLEAAASRAKASGVAKAKG